MMHLDWALMGPPLATGLLVVASHVLLGREVLKRGIIFIDLCIAQVAALGVVVAHALHLIGEEGYYGQGIAIGSALLAAVLLGWTEKRWPKLQEAIIGSLYVVSASAALLVLSHDPHGAEQLHRLLAGQILWVSYDQLLPLALSLAVVLGAWVLMPVQRQRLFYILFAIAITASVQQVGVFLVFASLILPALAVHTWSTRSGLAMGYSIGATGYLLGLILSLLLDLPAGPLIVCSLAILALLAAASQNFRQKH